MNNVIKFRAKCFEAYGLNSFRNFLLAPECKCGNKSGLVLENDEDLFAFANEMLEEYDCNCCAIFAHALNDEMFAIVKVEDEDDEDDNYYYDYDDYDEDYDYNNKSNIDLFSTKETDMTFFKEVDSMFRLCCYGLLIQNVDGSWDVIER